MLKWTGFSQSVFPTRIRSPLYQNMLLVLSGLHEFLPFTFPFREVAAGRGVFPRAEITVAAISFRSVEVQLVSRSVFRTGVVAPG